MCRIIHLTADFLKQKGVDLLPSNSEIVKTGVSLGFEKSAGRLIFGFRFGRYLHQLEVSDGWYYDALSFRAGLSQACRLASLQKTHFARADFIEVREPLISLNFSANRMYSLNKIFRLPFFVVCCFLRSMGLHPRWLFSHPKGDKLCLTERSYRWLIRLLFVVKVRCYHQD